jgi:hypothetical protein
VAHARTIWEEGREPGRRVVALAAALSLSAAALDIAVVGHLGLVYDVVFVLVSIATAILVRFDDLFTVGVLPPLLMVGVCLLLAITHATAIANPGDGVVQAVITGVARHGVALFVGYVLCLGCLAMRRHVVAIRTAAY